MIDRLILWWKLWEALLDRRIEAEFKEFDELVDILDPNTGGKRKLKLPAVKKDV